MDEIKFMLDGQEPSNAGETPAEEVASEEAEEVEKKTEAETESNV